MTDIDFSPPWRRRNIRLPLDAYARVGAICSVTVAVRDRRPVFADHATASAAVQVLSSHADKTAVRVSGYCVMPDHVHLVIEPSAKCDIITFVGQYKNLAQRAAWSHGVKGAFWQGRFWDHFLRAEDDVETVVQYVLENPVRRGLVGIWSDYLFSGSLIFSLQRESGGQAPTLRRV